MKIYKTQNEVERDIKDNVLALDESVEFQCSINIKASLQIEGNINARNINAWDISAWNINARNINAWDINAGDINARDISAGNINAWDISAWNINARNINAGDINARDINARDISAWNINAWDINARNILYYAFCVVYNSIKCISIKGRRVGYAEPIALDGKIEFKK